MRLLEREVGTSRAANPASGAELARGDHLFGRVPVTWMSKHAAAFPRMIELSARLTSGVGQVIVGNHRPWSVSRLGGSAARRLGGSAARRLGPSTGSCPRAP